MTTENNENPLERREDETDEQVAARLNATAEQQRQLAEESNAPRRFAMTDFLFDASNSKFWDTKLLQPREAVAVDRMIELADWPRGEPGPRGGQPPRIRPSSVIGQSGSLDPQYRDLKVQGVTYAPGLPRIIENVKLDDGGWSPSPGNRILNTYCAPDPCVGNPELADPWINHVKALWPEPAEHNYFFDACAHMVQRPEEKLHAGIVLSGGQGVGKDLTLDALKYCVGFDNLKIIGPDNVLSRWNYFVASVMLIISEVRPFKEDSKATDFYNALKDFCVGAKTYRLELKTLNTFVVSNQMRVFMTTNDPLAFYVDDDDRRLFLLHTNRTRFEFTEDYYTNLALWIEQTQGAHVRAWLEARDISKFNPKAAPPRTEKHRFILNSWKDVDGPVAWALNKLGKPDIFIPEELALVVAGTEQAEAYGKIKPRALPHIIEREGDYIPVQSSNSDGRWEIGSTRARSAYVKRDVAKDIPLEDVRALVEAHIRAFDKCKARKADEPGNRQFRTH